MFQSLFGPPLAPGTPAPPFALTDEFDRSVSLQSFKGKPVVLIFYPGDDTAICTKQLCEIRDDWAAFKKLGVHVFGVNGQSGASHTKFAAKHRFPFPLLVDRGWVTSRAYNAGWGLVRRTVYVIGPDGKIAYAQRGKPSTADILAAVEGSLSNDPTTS